MAGPDPAELWRVVDAFPAAPDGDDADRINDADRVDDLLDGTYSRLTASGTPISWN